MNGHHAPRRTMAAVAVRHRHRTRAITLFMLLALLTVAAVLFFINKSDPRQTRTETTRVRYSSADLMSSPWLMPEPLDTPIGKATDQPARTKAAAPEPDWSALSLGVSDAEAAAPAPAIGSEAASPAELVVALSHAERGRLIAAAREAESGPGPAGYRPPMASLVPAGSGDGICR